MNNLKNITQAAFSGIKNVIEYSVRLFTYIVTLGHYGFPRAKTETRDTSEQMKLNLPLETREIQTTSFKIEEADLFLKSLKTNEMQTGFKESNEYQEYLKDTNPFATIKMYYCKYFLKTLPESSESLKSDFLRSKGYTDYLSSTNPFSESLEEVYDHFQGKIAIFLKSLSEPITMKNDFFQSTEYGEYLTGKFKNPFAEGTIEEAYRNYTKSQAEKLRERMAEFEENRRIFQSDDKIGDGRIKKAFFDSATYLNDLKKMETDITFSSLLTLEDLKKAFENFVDQIPEENKKFLDSLNEDKKPFMDSHEYKKAINKELLTTNELREAYNEYKIRSEMEREQIAFIEELKNDSIFSKLSQSVEYNDVIKNPFYSLEELKVAVAQFKERDFIEQLTDSKEFTQSSQYKNLRFNKIGPINVKELEAAYKTFRIEKEVIQRSEAVKYLEELKKQIGDAVYDQFIQSNEYKGCGMTREGMKDAYAEFKKKNPQSWKEYLFG